MKVSKSRKSFKKEPNSLTEIAVRYKKNKDQSLLSKIINNTDKLVKYILYLEWVEKQCGKEAFEELYADCRTLILIRALEKFNKSKKMSFSSYYTLWMRSYIKAKKGVYTRRKEVYNALSIDKVVGQNSPSDFHNIFTKYDFHGLMRLKNRFQNDLEKGVLYEPIIKGESFYETEIRD